MKIKCPHCSQHLELDPETLVALEGASHFDCPTCGGAVEVPTPVLVPTRQAPPTQKGKTTPERVARRTQQGINRNLLVLGVVALIAIGGVAMFLASKNGGNIFNIFQNITNQIINNSYFTQLIADGVTTKDDLEAIAEIRPYGDGFIGVSKAAVTWEQSQELAKRTGAQVLAVDISPHDLRRDLLTWLATTFKSHVASPTWVLNQNVPGVLASSEILAVKAADGERKVLLHWQASTPTLTASTKDRPFKNSLGMKFVPVPETNVLMCIHETRRQDYEVFASVTPSIDVKWKDLSADGFTLTDYEEHHPVMEISWEDAQKFCAWLSQKEAKTYRLPTDVEWNAAVGLGRAGNPIDGNRTEAQSEKSEFPWGDNFPPMSQTPGGNYSDLSRKMKAPNDAMAYLEDYDDGYPTTAPVMSFKPNSLGLYDLSGNVWEWCENQSDAAKEDRILRGASWGDWERDKLLSSHHRYRKPDYRDYGLGFRCVIEISSQDSVIRLIESRK